MRELPLSHRDADGFVRAGSVQAVSARTVTVRALGLTTGACVSVARYGRPPAEVEVVDVAGDLATCVPLGDAAGIVVGARATSALARVGSFVGPSLLGRDADAWGRCAGAQPRVAVWESKCVATAARVPIDRPLRCGVTAIDAFATLGRGQRIALLAGAGVGKTTLLRRIVDGASVDARVVALVGERGREAAEAIAYFAGERRSAQTTVICATADAPPMERLTAARTATVHAQALAAGGRDVLLVVDSLTRVATAWRELALAAGEPPAYRGHPPSLPGALAQLVERAGAVDGGTITAVYAVLVDADDTREPVTDSVRGLLDGHIALSRELADAGRFPAIDVLRSLSRTMERVTTIDHRRDAATVRAAIAALEGASDLFAIGAYRPGGDRALDAAVAARPAIDALIHDEAGPAPDPVARLADIARTLREASPELTAAPPAVMSKKDFAARRSP